MSRYFYVRALLLALCFSISLFGQRDLGAITGTITDPTGAAIPSAKVVITVP